MNNRLSQIFERSLRDMPDKPGFFLRPVKPILDEGALMRYAWWADACETIIHKEMKGNDLRFP